MAKLPSQMNTTELWQWHAEVYAFRRVVLGVSRDVRTSPCDESGQWFNAERVDAAERRLIAKREPPDKRQRDAQMARDGRAAANAWAQTQGYSDIDAYMHGERLYDKHGQLDWSMACLRVALSNLRAASTPNDPNAKFDPHAAAALGVKAREYQPTPKQMKAARQELGIEEPEEEPSDRA